MGMTFATLSCDGKTPCAKEELIMLDSMPLKPGISAAAFRAPI